MSCFSVNIFGYEADKIIRRPHRFLFFIFKLFYLLTCNARHTGFLDFFGIIFQKNGQKTLFLPLYCWLNTSVSFWNIKPLQNQKNVSFLGKRDFCTVFCDGHYILAYSNKSINFVTKSRIPYLLWCDFIFSWCLRNTFS